MESSFMCFNWRLQNAAYPILINVFMVLFKAKTLIILPILLCFLFDQINESESEYIIELNKSRSSSLTQKSIQIAQMEKKFSRVQPTAF